MCARFSLSRLLKSLLILSLLNAQVGLAAPPRIELSLPEGNACLWGLRFSTGPSKPLTFLADLCSAAVTPSPETLTWRDLSAYAAATGVERASTHLTLRNPSFEIDISYPNESPLEFHAAFLKNVNSPPSNTSPFHLFVPADPDDSATSLLDVRALIDGPLVLHCEARQLKTSQLFQVSGLLSGLDLDVLHNQGSLLLSAVTGTVNAFMNDNISRIGQWSSHITRLQNTGKLWLEKGQYEVKDLVNTGTVVLGANSDTPVTGTDSSGPSGTTETNAWTLLQGMNPALNATLVPDLITCRAMLTVDGHPLDRPLPDCETFQKAQSNEVLLPLLKEKALRTLCAAEGFTPVTSYLKTPTLRGVVAAQSDVAIEDKLAAYPFLTLSGQGSLTIFDGSQAPLSLNELENLPFASVRAFVDGPVILPHAVTIPDLTVVSSHPTCLSLLHPLATNSLTLSLPCLSVGSPQSLTTLSAAKLFLHASGEQGIDFSNAKVGIGPQGGVLLAQQGPFRLGRLVSQGLKRHPILDHQHVSYECKRRDQSGVWSFHNGHPCPSTNLFAGLSEFTEIPFQKEGWETFQGNGAGLFSAGPLFISGTNWHQEGSLLFSEKDAVFHVSGEVSILSGQIESRQSIIFAGGTHFSLGRPLPTRVYTSRSTGCCESSYSYEDRQSTPKSLIYGKEAVHIDFPSITVFGSEILSLKSPVFRPGAALQEKPYILWQGLLTARHSACEHQPSFSSSRNQLALEPSVIFTREDFTLQGNTGDFNGMVDASGQVGISLAGSGIFANHQRTRQPATETFVIDLTDAAKSLMIHGFWQPDAKGQLTPAWGGENQDPLPSPVLYQPQVKGALAGPQNPHAVPFFIYGRSLLESLLDRSLAQHLKTLNLGAPNDMTTLDYLLQNAAELKKELGRDIHFTDIQFLKKPVLVYVRNADGGLAPHLLAPPHLMNQADIRGNTVSIHSADSLTFVSNAVQAKKRLDVRAQVAIVRERAPAYTTIFANGNTVTTTQNPCPSQVFYSGGGMKVVAQDSYLSIASYTEADGRALIYAVSGNAVSRPEILTSQSVTTNEGNKGFWRSSYVDSTVKVWHSIYPDVVKVGDKLDSQAGATIFQEASQIDANSITYTAPQLTVTPAVAVNKNSVTVEESGLFSDSTYHAFQESLEVVRATITATQDMIFNVTSATLSGVTLMANTIYNYATNFTINMAKQEVRQGEFYEKTTVLGAGGNKEEGGQEKGIVSEIFADRWINVGPGEMKWTSVHGMIGEMMLNEKNFVQGTEILKSWMKSESWRVGLSAPAVNGGSNMITSDPLISSAQNMGDAANSPNGVQDQIAAIAKFSNQFLSDLRIAHAFWTDSKMRMGDKLESPWKALAARYATIALSYAHTRSSSNQNTPLPGNLAVGLMVADNDLIALAGDNTIEKAVLTTKSFTSTGAKGTAEATSSSEHGSVSYNFITGNVGLNGGYSTSHQSQVQNTISRTHIDDLYLRTGDILVSGGQVIGRLVDVIATGDVSIQSVLDTFEMCQSQASFSISLDGSLPDVTLGDKSKSEAVVRSIAGIVGTEKFLLTVGGQLSLLSADVGLRPDGVFVKQVTSDHIRDTYEGKQSITVDGETILDQLYEFSDEDGFYINAWAGTAQAIMNNIDAFKAEMEAADLKAQAEANAQEFSDRTEPDHDRINQATMTQFGAEIDALVERWVADLLGDTQDHTKPQTSPAPKAEDILRKTPASSKKPSTAAQELLASWEGAYEFGIESVSNPWDLVLGPVRMAKIAKRVAEKGFLGITWIQKQVTSALAKSFSKRHIENAPKIAEKIVERAAQSKDRWADWRLPKSDLDKKALDAAKEGKGKLFMENLKDPKFKGMDKYRHIERSADGQKSVVHYVKDPKTGKTMDFKFQKRSDGSTYRKDPITGEVRELKRGD